MAFKAKKVKKGSFEIDGLEAYIDRTVQVLERELRALIERELGGGAKRGKADVSKASKSTKSSKVTKGLAAEGDPLSQVLAAHKAHPKAKALARAGKQKDQLLRSLIPLYVARPLGLELTSGVASKFWAKHGVTFAAPNAAKVLREHKGYAKRGSAGVRITEQGVAYVEAALR